MNERAKERENEREREGGAGAGYLGLFGQPHTTSYIFLERERQGRRANAREGV